MLEKNATTFKNILTEEDKTTYSGFAKKIRSLPSKELFELNSNMADKLSSEMKDIVAFEIRAREFEIIKKQNLDPKQYFSSGNGEGNNNYDKETPNLSLRKMQEREYTDGMSDELLQREKEVVENTYIPVDKNNLHTIGKGGVNILWKKYAVAIDDGNQIKINNEEIQKKFRKNYIKRLSEVTGIDYEKYNEEPDISSDKNEYFNSDEMASKDVGIDNSIKQNLTSTIDVNEYSDD
jgi:hypothetical protein